MKMTGNSDIVFPFLKTHDGDYAGVKGLVQGDRKVTQTIPDMLNLSKNKLD
jgi:hypothetical protein